MTRLPADLQVESVERSGAERIRMGRSGMSRLMEIMQGNARRGVGVGVGGGGAGGENGGTPIPDTYLCYWGRVITVAGDGSF